MSEPVVPKSGIRSLPSEGVSKLDLGKHIGYNPATKDTPEQWYYLVATSRVKVEKGKQTVVKETHFLTHEQVDSLSWGAYHKRNLVANGNTSRCAKTKKAIVPMTPNMFERVKAEAEEKKLAKKRKREEAKKTSKKKNKKKKPLVPPPSEDDSVQKITEPESRYSGLTDWAGYGGILTCIHLLKNGGFVDLRSYIESPEGLKHPAILGSFFKNKWMPCLVKADRIDSFDNVEDEITAGLRGQAFQSLELGIKLILNIYNKHPEPSEPIAALLPYVDAELDMCNPAVMFMLSGGGVKDPESWKTFFNHAEYPVGDTDHDPMFAAVTLLGMLIGFAFYVIA